MATELDHPKRDSKSTEDLDEIVARATAAAKADSAKEAAAAKKDAAKPTK